MLRRVAGVLCVHYIEQKNCTARFAIQGLCERFLGYCLKVAERAIKEFRRIK